MTRARFEAVIDGKYCRPSSLRQLVMHYKTATARTEERKKEAVTGAGNDAEEDVLRATYEKDVNIRAQSMKSNSVQQFAN